MIFIHSLLVLIIYVFVSVSNVIDVSAFVVPQRYIPLHKYQQQQQQQRGYNHMSLYLSRKEDDPVVVFDRKTCSEVNTNNNNWQHWIVGLALFAITTTSTMNFAVVDISSSSSPMLNYNIANAATSSTVVDSTDTTSSSSSTTKNYDGFAEYAKENKMEQSDVSCFIQQCGIETKELFRNPRGIKGIVCLGKCKGEQSCATQCFAQYNSQSLNNWLSCTIEEHECVKVPTKVIDNSAENYGYTTSIQNFNPSSLIGTWYKTNGLNPNYDLFDCQTNTFTATSSSSNNELDMGIFFRVQRPIETGGGFWENELTEHMIVDTPTTTTTNDVPKQDAVLSNTNEKINQNDETIGRTMHTSGKMYGLQFNENWYIIGESDGSNNIPPFKLVAYKGHTLQGNYEGAFVYAKEPVLPSAAIPAVRDAAQKAGLDFDQFRVIDNTCPIGNPLNDDNAGTGTSTTDWIDLIIGEGGVIDWISPGWRGEYKQK